VTYCWIGIKDSSFLPYFLFIFVRASRHHLLYARICISLCRATRRQHHGDTPQPRYIIIFNNNLRSTYLECKRRDGPSTVPDPFSILSFVTVRLLPFLPVRRLKLHRHATIVRNKRLSELSIAPDDSLMIILIVIWDRMWSYVERDTNKFISDLIATWSIVRFSRDHGHGFLMKIKFRWKSAWYHALKIEIESPRASCIVFGSHFISQRTVITLLHHFYLCLNFTIGIFILRTHLFYSYLSLTRYEWMMRRWLKAAYASIYLLAIRLAGFYTRYARMFSCSFIFILFWYKATKIKATSIKFETYCIHHRFPLECLTARMFNTYVLITYIRMLIAFIISIVWSIFLSLNFYDRSWSIDLYDACRLMQI